MVGVKGLGHVPRPRNFIFANMFSREDFLANCHRQFSPSTYSSRSSKSLRPAMKKPSEWTALSLVGVKGLEPSTSRSQTARASQLRHTPTCEYYIMLMFESGLGHVPRPRNFIFENKFSREGFLANCHRQFSPSTSRSQIARASQLRHTPTSP